MSYANLLYHIIFSTKDRQSMIRDHCKEKLFAYMGGIFCKSNAKLLAANAMADHVHLYASLRPEPSVAKILNLIKANSSKWIHESFEDMKDFQWQVSYGAFSVSKSSEKDVIAYIRNQQIHHKKKTFKEEFIEFLDRHNVSYDPRYIWQ